VRDHPRLAIFSNRNLSAASGVNLLVGFCIMVALVSVLIHQRRGRGRHDESGSGHGIPALRLTVPMAPRRFEADFRAPRPSITVARAISMSASG
jgi:hypothetical protein